MNLKKRKMSTIVKLHYAKLVFRSCLFLTAFLLYVYNRLHNTGETFSGFEENDIFLGIIWVIFLVEMLLRFFPSPFESMGCQKQFGKNYNSKEKNTIRISTWKSTAAVATAWLALNFAIGMLRVINIIDDGILLLVALFYSVCDVICILFFCPFQTWLMKNKCCGSCRIYNWDYAMMFTPFLFIHNVYAVSLLGIALLLLIKWEVTVRAHPERFFEETNEALSCSNCREKLCCHKKQLRIFLKNGKYNLKGNKLFKRG